MPLSKASITIPLANGIDTKTDAKHVDPMGLLTLENGRLDKTGTIEKRNGHTYFSHAPDVSGQAWGATSSLMSQSGTELIQIGKSVLSAGGSLSGDDSGWCVSTYDSTLTKWHEIGREMPMELSSTTASSSSSGIDNPDVERANGYLCFAWENAGDILFSLIHEATGAVIAQDVSLGESNGEAPKVLAIGNVFWIWALETATPQFKYATLDTAALPTLPSTMTAFAAAGTPHADLLWDAVQLTHTTHGDCSVICYKDTAAGGLIVRWIDSTPALQASITVPSLTPPINCIGCNKVENRFGVDFLSIAWQHNPGAGNAIYHQIMAMDNSWSFANPVLLGSYAQTAMQITMIHEFGYNGSAGPDTCRYYIEFDSGAWPRQILAYRARQDNGVSYGTAQDARAAGLASRAFVCEGWPAVWAVRTGLSSAENTQPSLFLLSNRMAADIYHHDVHAKALTSEADYYYNQPGLPKVIQSGTDPEYMTAVLRQDRSNQLQKSVSRLVLPGPESLSVVGLTVDLQKSALDTVESGDDLIIATGGTLACKSGGLVTECGFHLYPESLGLTTQTSGGNLTDTTEYFYTAIYEWTDRAGQIHRSAPATVQSITTGSPGTNANKVTASIDSLIFTEATKGDEVLVVLYRRCSDGLYHRVDAQTNIRSNQVTVCTDTITDTVAIANETLYTTGGILENTGPQATRIVTEGGGRIAYIPEEDRTLVCLSKVRSNGLGPEFAIELTRRVTEGGNATALAYLGQSYIVFKENEIHAFGGAGPNVLGVGAWGPNRKIAGNVGCSERKSLVDCGLGVAFKSNKGIYLLTPSGETKYIGAPVESYNTETIKCAVHVPDSNHVRWYLADASKTALVWDYAVNQWAVFTGLNPIDACVWGGEFTGCVSPGAVYKEDTTYRDGTTDIDMKIGTAWFKPGDTLGAQRVWWVYLLGEYKSAHTLTVNVFYDYNDTAAETFTWTLTSDPDPYLVRFKPARQRCTAFRMEIADSAQGGTYEGFSLSAVKLEIGVQDKRGPRLRASRTL